MSEQRGIVSPLYFQPGVFPLFLTSFGGVPVSEIGTNYEGERYGELVIDDFDGTQETSEVIPASIGQLVYCTMEIASVTTPAGATGGYEYDYGFRAIFCDEESVMLPSAEQNRVGEVGGIDGVADPPLLGPEQFNFTIPSNAYMLLGFVLRNHVRRSGGVEETATVVPGNQENSGGFRVYIPGVLGVKQEVPRGHVTPSDTNGGYMQPQFRVGA